MDLVVAGGGEETDHTITDFARAHILEDRRTSSSIPEGDSLPRCVAAGARAGAGCRRCRAEAQRIHHQDARGHLRLSRVGIGSQQLEDTAAALSQDATAADSAGDGGKIRIGVPVVVDNDFPVAASHRCRRDGRRSNHSSPRVEVKLGGVDDARNRRARGNVHVASEYLADGQVRRRAAGKIDGRIVGDGSDIDGFRRTRSDREAALNLHFRERRTRAQCHAAEDEIRSVIPSRSGAADVDSQLRRGSGDPPVDPVKSSRSGIPQGAGKTARAFQYAAVKHQIGQQREGRSVLGTKDARVNRGGPRVEVRCVS